MIRVAPLATAVVLAALPAPTAPARAAEAAWGRDGHVMAARAAAATLPASMPAFFRDAAEQLAWLDVEPDRWRSRELRAMDQAWTYDHYIDLENVPAGALEAPDRWEYLRRLRAAGLERPERDAGFAPYRILELYERLVAGWRRWAAADPAVRPWIEARIVNDAGVLGHYVTDVAQPLHTTVHYNGWAEGAPNPSGFTRDRELHARFEAAFVSAAVDGTDVVAALPPGPPPVLADVRAAVLAHVRQSHARVEDLYRLERDVGFDPARPDPRAVPFAVERLAAGSDVLRALWWTAFRAAVTSDDRR